MFNFFEKKDTQIQNDLVTDEIEVNLVSAYEKSDQDIARAAMNAFKLNYAVPESVQVTVDKGWLTLTGEADWEYQKNAAKISVTHLLGVCGVTNNITITAVVRQGILKRVLKMRSSVRQKVKAAVEVSGSRVSLKN